MRMLSSVTHKVKRFVASVLRADRLTATPQNSQAPSKRMSSEVENSIVVQENEDEHYMFVYGTLKRSQPNNHYVEDQSLGSAHFICSGHTTNKYPLVIAGQYNIPYLLYAPGRGHHVQGEVYKVSTTKRDFMDDFESHPNYYERMQEEIIVHQEDLRNGCLPSDHHSLGSLTSTIKCWVYFMKNFKPDMLELEPMACYDSKGIHGKQYVERFVSDASFLGRKIKIYGSISNGIATPRNAASCFSRLCTNETTHSLSETFRNDEGPPA